MYCINCNTKAPHLKLGNHKPRMYIKDMTKYGYERKDIAEANREVLVVLKILKNKFCPYLPQFSSNSYDTDLSQKLLNNTQTPVILCSRHKHCYIPNGTH